MYEAPTTPRGTDIMLNQPMMEKLAYAVAGHGRSSEGAGTNRAINELGFLERLALLVEQQ